MPGESLPNPEILFERFTKFVDNHADVVLDPEFPGLDITRESIWNVSDRNQIVPIDEVTFRVAIDLTIAKTMYHEIIFRKNGNTLFWVGFDSGNSSMAAGVGEGNTVIDFENENLDSLIDNLASLEMAGGLTKNSSQ